MTDRSTKEAEMAKFAEPDFLTDLVDEVSSGKTLSRFANEKKVRYGSLYQWLHSDEERVAKYTKALESRQNMVSDLVLNGLIEIAQLDLRRMFDKDGRLLDINELPGEVARLLSSIEVDQAVTKGEDGHDVLTKTAKVRVPDRLKSLNDLGRSVGMFKDKVEHSGGVRVMTNEEDEKL